MLRSVGIAVTVCLLARTSAAQQDRDFSGRWAFDPQASQTPALAAAVEPSLVITQQGGKIVCRAGAAEWSYALDGSDSVFQAGAETRNSAVKWEGAALLINTLVSGAGNYAIMDRWTLSRDRNVLTIDRQIDNRGRLTEGRLIYRREGQPMMAVRAPMQAPAPVAAAAAPAPDRYVIPAGTHILLALINSVDTKHSRAGDRIYLQTVVPVAVSGRVVIPRGTSVAGSVSDAKRAGRAAGKGELFIRFESLTLRNGVTRDFRSRLANADVASGKVDREEGKISGEHDTAGEARTVARDAGMGASIGGIAGAASGAPMKGVGIGGAAGAAAGLASVLLKHGPEAVLPKGTHVEMVLDRDVAFTAEETRF